MIGNTKTLPVPLKAKLVTDEETQKLLARQSDVQHRMGDKYVHHPVHARVLREKQP